VGDGFFALCTVLRRSASVMLTAEILRFAQDDIAFLAMTIFDSKVSG
jgi:hypothetical protein